MDDLSKIDLGLRPRTDLGTEWIDQNLLILDKHNQKIHQLNRTASTIWESLAEGRNLDAIAEEMVAAFEVTPAIALRDANRALEQFCELNLLES